MRNKIHFVFLVSALFLSALLAPRAEAVPTVPATGLDVRITENGRISLSADGAGSNAGGGITIQVNKPNAAATVRSAFLACASNFDRVINDGDVSLDGNRITWAASVQNNAGGSPTFFNNVFANVTAIVKTKVDAAVPGLVDFTQTEVNTGSIDGCALYAVFDDPSQTTDNTVFIFFGGQNTNGDAFSVTLARPLSGSDRAEMGLGISFSAQPGGMVSNIDVNSLRLTSSAGGQDDGAGANGALLTVGGIGDSTANPAPNAPATSVRTDDELYDLRPFVNPPPGDPRRFLVATNNPTDDDNIFAGHIFVPTAIEGVIQLTQLTDTNPVGAPHTVTARVVNSLGQPVSGRVVDFQVVSGPNAGTSNSGTSNADGQASFTYIGTGSPGTRGDGTDVIVAGFTDSTGTRRTSNVVQKIWVVNVAGPPPGPGGRDLTCRGATRCSIPLTCPLSALSCVSQVRVLVARKFLPRRTAPSSADTAAKAPRRMIVFAFSSAVSSPPGVTRDVPLRRTRNGKRISRSGRRSLPAAMEIRSSAAGAAITSTRIGIKIR